MEVIVSNTVLAYIEFLRKSKIGKRKSLNYLQKCVNDQTQEMIMCRNCRNYDIAQNGVNGICNMLEIPMYADDWCSRAERRTDEEVEH